MPRAPMADPMRQTRRIRRNCRRRNMSSYSLKGGTHKGHPYGLWGRDGGRASARPLHRDLRIDVVMQPAVGWCLLEWGDVVVLHAIGVDVVSDVVQRGAVGAAGRRGG